ncbi:hypothetical protein BH09MYX1_BH09MYX1_03450 [soil metagenome]
MQATTAVPNATGFAACGRSLVASDEALRAIEIDGCPKLEGDDLAFLGCSPSCAWAMSIERAIRLPVAGDPCGDIGLVVSLTHFAQDGSAVVAAPGASLADTWHVPEGDVKVNLSILQGPGSRHLDEPQFFDFDGDGDEEVIVFCGANEEGGDPELHEMWTFKNGAVAGYAPATGLAFDGTTQLDADHRPDLTSRGPYAKILAESETGDSYPIAPHLFVLQSLVNGTFDIRSPAALDYAKTQCGVESTIDWPSAAFDDGLAMAIVCARLHGASEDDLHAASAKRCHAVDRCPAWVSALIDTPPPFVFP